MTIRPLSTNQNSTIKGKTIIKSGNSNDGLTINTTDNASISSGVQVKPGEGLIDKSMSLVKNQGGEEKASENKETEENSEVKSPEKEISITIPFEKHLENASVFILEKTAKQYPGFGKNIDGKSRKAHQIQSHLKDFVEYVKKETPGDLAGLGDDQRKVVVKSATEFVADKIGDEYGMAPHMRRSGIFLSPIRSNVSDYLEYLSKENVTISADENGNITATKFFTKEAAMEALNDKGSVAAASSGNEVKSETPADSLEKKTITRTGNSIIIGGVKLQVNN